MPPKLVVGAVLVILLCSSLPAEASSPTSSTPATSTPSTTPASTPAATTAASTTPTTTPTAEAAAPATTTPAKAAAPAATVAAPATVTKPATAAAPAAAATKATVAAPAAAPVAAPKAATKTPNVVKLSPPPPAAPAPIVIDQSKLVPALPAAQTVSSPSAAPAASNASSPAASQTAADIVLQISGSGVTPFGIPQQTVLLRAMASVLTTVSLSDLRIRYVTSAVNQRRRLLAEDLPLKTGRSLLANDTAAAVAAANGDLYNVAAVTLEANCSSNTAVPATMTEMQSVLSNNLLASAIQAYGESSWGVSLLSLTSVNPNVALDTAVKCKKNLGSLCLDNTSLTVAEAEVIMAIGCLVVVMLVAIPCVWLEWRRKSGQMAELDPTPETPRTPLDKVQQFYNNLVSKAKAASPLHRGGGSNKRNVFKSDSPRTGNGAVQMTATA